MPKDKRLRFWWPWFSWRCDECNTRHWSWRGFWYRPSDLVDALPTIIAEFRSARESTGVFSRDGLILTRDEPDAYGRIWAGEVTANAKD